MIQEEIFKELKKILVSEFELEEETVTMDALLREDLNLDSIDAIDLFVKMKEYIPAGKGNIDPSILRTVRTVRDVVEALAPYLSDEAPAAAPETKDPSDKAEN
ncbi:acyl carrier protein [bacterium]|jgi:acyl carrier protein|nr:acyl carrier protein [bacterium]MBR4531730.1 acyl carrier protein [bacterium]